MTEQFRVPSTTGLQPDQHFIGITKPHAPVQVCTIARLVKAMLKGAGIEISQHIPREVHQLQQQGQEELRCKKFCLKLTGHRLVLFISIISDHSHFRLFHQLFLQSFKFTC